jgi:putative DNA primase/helicase
MKDIALYEIEEAFECWLGELGISPASGARLRLDGKKRRYRVSGDRSGEENGEYCVYIDERPAGWVKSYSAKHGVEYATWSFYKEGESPWTEEERCAYIEEMKKRRESSEKEAALERERAIALARKKWEAATEPDPARPHPYIKLKGLSGTHGARVLGKELVIPCYNAHGEIVNVQTIDPNRETPKLFQKSAPKKGTFFVIGKEESGSGIVLVCEGFATGATIHETTGRPVVVAWDLGNIAPVVSILRERFPGRLVLAPDNDRKTAGNPGMAAAFEILEEFGVPFVMPEFKPDEKGSDWNDYAALHDVERTCEALYESLAKLSEDAEVKKFLSFPRFIGISKSGVPNCTKENLQILLGHEGIGARYDEVKKDICFFLPDRLKRRLNPDNEQNAIYAQIVSLCEKYRYSTRHLDEYLTAVAAENAFNPISDWIESKSWDGVDRFGALLETVRVKAWFSAEMKELLIRRWMISAVAALLNKKFHCRGVLIFQGEQSMGKTSWFRALVPPSSHWFIEGVSLNPDDKDSLKKVVSHWVVELGEFEGTLKKADINKLKSFVTSQSDVVRLPWARKFSDFQRRTVMCASVNQADFLTDTTGNSRWWVIPCVRVNYAHGLDMQQVWAQVRQMYRDEPVWWLSREEEAELNKLNRNFEMSDEVEDLIGAGYPWDRYEEYLEARDGDWINATLVLKACGIQNPNKIQVRRAGEVLRELTKCEPKRMGKGRDRCYWVPRKREFYT